MRYLNLSRVYMRVTRTEFYEILDLIKDDISRDDSTSRDGVGPEEQLVITLRQDISYSNLIEFTPTNFNFNGVMLRKDIPSFPDRKVLTDFGPVLAGSGRTLTLTSSGRVY